MKYLKDEIEEKFKSALALLSNANDQMEAEGYELSDFESVFEGMDYDLREFMYSVYDGKWKSSYSEWGC